MAKVKVIGLVRGDSTFSSLQFEIRIFLFGILDFGEKS
jgi:hypothetical protein